jgi:hypothetical protein
MSRMVIYEDVRFSAVPWISTVQDLRRQGPPETGIDDYAAGYHQDGLLIRSPFGQTSDAILTITAKRGNGNDGGEIRMAIGTVLYRAETEPACVPVQSNPHRHVDGYRGDEGDQA